mmetsp:Transcript_51154/g.136734  ORF Transcript_51154/g.136734 Transcript_51154/m.136734 type:complete len:209 (+) Transcript_51154:48-674(+)
MREVQEAKRPGRQGRAHHRSPPRRCREGPLACAGGVQALCRGGPLQALGGARGHGESSPAGDVQHTLGERHVAGQVGTCQDGGAHHVPDGHVCQRRPGQARQGEAHGEEHRGEAPHRRRERHRQAPRAKEPQVQDSGAGAWRHLAELRRLGPQWLRPEEPRALEAPPAAGHHPREPRQAQRDAAYARDCPRRGAECGGGGGLREPGPR